MRLIVAFILVLLFGWVRAGEAQAHDGPHKFGKNLTNTPEGVAQKCDLPGCPEVRLIPARRAPSPGEMQTPPAVPNEGWRRPGVRFNFGKKGAPINLKDQQGGPQFGEGVDINSPDQIKKPPLFESVPPLPGIPPSQIFLPLPALPESVGSQPFQPAPFSGQPTNPWVAPPLVGPSPAPLPPLPSYGPGADQRRPGFLDLRSMAAPPGLIGSALPAILEYAGYATIGATIVVASGPYLVLQAATGMENTAALAAEGLVLLRSAGGFFVVRAVSAAGSLLVAPGCTSAGCAPRPSFPGNKAPSPFGIPGVQYPLQPRPKSWPSR